MQWGCLPVPLSGPWPLGLRVSRGFLWSSLRWTLVFRSLSLTKPTVQPRPCAVSWPPRPSRHPSALPAVAALGGTEGSGSGWPRADTCRSVSLELKVVPRSHMNAASGGSLLTSVTCARYCGAAEGHAMASGRVYTARLLSFRDTALLFLFSVQRTTQSCEDQRVPADAVRRLLPAGEGGVRALGGPVLGGGQGLRTAIPRRQARQDFLTQGHHNGPSGPGRCHELGTAFSSSPHALRFPGRGPGAEAASGTSDTF